MVQYSKPFLINATSAQTCVCVREKEREGGSERDKDDDDLELPVCYSTGQIVFDVTARLCH